MPIVNQGKHSIGLSDTPIELALRATSELCWNWSHRIVWVDWLNELVFLGRCASRCCIYTCSETVQKVHWADCHTCARTHNTSHGTADAVDEQAQSSSWAFCLHLAIVLALVWRRVWCRSWSHTKNRCLGLYMDIATLGGRRVKRSWSWRWTARAKGLIQKSSTLDNSRKQPIVWSSICRWGSTTLLGLDPCVWSCFAVIPAQDGDEHEAKQNEQALLGVLHPSTGKVQIRASNQCVSSPGQCHRKFRP